MLLGNQTTVFFFFLIVPNFNKCFILHAKHLPLSFLSLTFKIKENNLYVGKSQFLKTILDIITLVND